MFVLAAVGVYGLTVALFAPLARRLVPAFVVAQAQLRAGRGARRVFVVLGGLTRHGERRSWISTTGCCSRSRSTRRR
jgi:hypothetical protein